MCKSLFHVFLEHCTDGLGLWSTDPPRPPPIKSRVSDNKQFSYRKLPHSLIVMGFGGISRKYSIWVLVSSTWNCFILACKKNNYSARSHSVTRFVLKHWVTESMQLKAIHTNHATRKQSIQEFQEKHPCWPCGKVIWLSVYLWSITMRNK